MSKQKTSLNISMNTCSPQGCVMSAFLFIVYINAMSENSDHCIIIKYADDTIVIGLIKDHDESHYRNTITCHKLVLTKLPRSKCH